MIFVFHPFCDGFESFVFSCADFVELKAETIDANVCQKSSELEQDSTQNG